eukprot:Gregarina_sp_Pseudo_9__1634@NODE_20_length_5835_cov_12_005003_g18_i0_p1_GENE_NODE_20_length_5835_cov_12_005003_g18_i0NODE_20_length_5835_cov_12_005003_g18_i0_p1_ORF_typecomplete_len567_score158_70FGGY_N/PF00370_21/1_8e75FGGY_C/PF02782_16/4_6e68ROK/PF00480_20/0_096_NODE_20_length_5835_cov_12_005003_g18_i022113911
MRAPGKRLGAAFENCRTRDHLEVAAGGRKKEASDEKVWDTVSYKERVGDFLAGMEKYVVALDQGTTSSRALLIAKDGRVLRKAQRELPQLYPKPGWVEQDAEEIFVTIHSCLQELLSEFGPERIEAVGIANQRETTIVWERQTGRPVCNAVVWQCRRSTQLCERYKQDPGMVEYIRQNTGLVLDPYFSATKIRWILENVDNCEERARNGELLFGTVNTWLLWRLSGGQVHLTDVTNGSRTMLMNIHTLQWDDKLLEYFRIPRCMLPEIRSASEIYTHLDLERPVSGGGASPATGPRVHRVPVASMAGDQQASLIGQLCLSPGMAKNTYGTGCFMLMNLGDKPVISEHGLLTTLCCDAQGRSSYALEGAVFICGASIQWLRDELRFLRDAADSEYFASKVKDTNGVYLVPAFAGLGAPYWDPHARGAIFGLTRGVNSNHIIRATLESIAYQTRDVLEAMQKDSKIQLKSLRVDGGATDNNFLMQFQADILGCPVERPDCKEASALGAGFLAGLATGFWTSLEEIELLTNRVFHPNFTQEQRDKKYKKWQNAVARVGAWEDQDSPVTP